MQAKLYSRMSNMNTIFLCVSYFLFFFQQLNTLRLPPKILSGFHFLQNDNERYKDT